MEPEQQQPYVVDIALHIYYSVIRFPKMLFEVIVGLITAILSEPEIFLLVSGLVLLSLVLPWQFVAGGALVFYATLRTIKYWIGETASAQAQQLTQIAQVMNTEKRVAIVQVPEILTRKVELASGSLGLGNDDQLSWEDGDTGDENGN